MPVVVNFHGLGIDVGLKRVGRIRQRVELERAGGRLGDGKAGSSGGGDNGRCADDEATTGDGHALLLPCWIVTMRQLRQYHNSDLQHVHVAGGLLVPGRAERRTDRAPHRLGDGLRDRAVAPAA